MANKTTAAQRRKRFALSEPDVWVLRPPYPNQFLALRLKSGRKVMQRTLSKDEVDFLVWMLGQYLWMDVPGATSAKDALIQACDRSWAQALGR